MFNSGLNKEIIKLTVCYLKDTKRFDESIIWNMYCFFIFFCFLFVFVIIILFWSLLFYISLHRDADFWHIFTNPESIFSGLSSFEFFIESLYASYFIYIKFFFLLPFFIFIYAYISFVCSYVFHLYRPCWKRFPYKISLWSESLVLYLYFRTFYFCVELWVFANVKYRKKNDNKQQKRKVI